MRAKTVFFQACLPCLLIAASAFGWIGSVYGQSSGGKIYRRPSAGDVEWLLGSGKPKVPQRQVDCDAVVRDDSCDAIVQAGYCEPAACEKARKAGPCEPEAASVCRRRDERAETVLRNPACCCGRCDSRDDCRMKSSAPLPPNPGLPKKRELSETSVRPTLLETAELDAERAHPAQIVAIPPGEISQTSAEAWSAPESPDEFPREAQLDEIVTPDAPVSPVVAKTPVKHPPVLPPKAPIRPQPLKSESAPAPPAPVPVAEKTASKHRSPVREYAPSNCLKSCEEKGMSCVSSFGVSGDCSCAHCRGHVDEIVASTLIGDCLRKITCLYRARSQHGPCCTCWLCADLDTPDMVGDAAWMPGRRIGFVVPAPDDSGVYFDQTAPTALLSRLNIAEHFNAEARDRFWVDYRHFNNAASQYGDGRYGLSETDRGVDQFTFALEKRLMTCSSLELRVPLLYQFDSGVDLTRLGQGAAELGNIAVVYKYVFARTSDFSFTGGVGVTLPTAEDWKIRDTGATLKNKSYNVVPYLGMQWHPNESTFGHALAQVDFPIAKNELRYGTGSLKLADPTLIRLGVQVGRWFYRNERGMHSCRLGGFVELDYTATIDKADTGYVYRVGNGGSFVAVGAEKSKPQPINLIGGLPVLFGQLSIVNAVAVPVTSSDRHFSVAYHFSVSRRF